MLDVIGTTVLTAVIAVNLNAIIVTMPLSATEKLTTVTIAGLWIGFAIALANTGVYASPATPPAIGIVAATSVLAVGAVAWLSPRARAALMYIPLPLVIGLNAARIAPGAFMVLLAVQGRLSGPFPQFAGWGDVTVGVIAIPLMIATARNLSRHRGAVLAWNALGTLDLISAAALGVLSAPGSPLQIFGGSIGSIAITSLPWSNIPTLIVPFYLIMHGVIFARLAGARGCSASSIVVAVQLPVDNGNSGDTLHCVVALSPEMRLNRVILRRWETIASVSGSSSRLSRRAAAPDQNTAGR